MNPAALNSPVHMWTWLVLATKHDSNMQLQTVSGSPLVSIQALLSVHSAREA